MADEKMGALVGKLANQDADAAAREQEHNFRNRRQQDRLAFCDLEAAKPDPEIHEEQQVAVPRQALADEAQQDQLVERAVHARE